MGENKPKDKTGQKFASSNKISSPVISSNALSASSSVNVVQTNIALQFVMKGEVDKLVQCFESATDPNHETISIQISQRSTEDGRSPLDWAAILDRDSIIPELLKRGVDVNSVTEKGYTAAHFAAAWGQVASLRALINGGTNLNLKNVYNETPMDVARRYKKLACIDLINWTDVKTALKSTVLTAKEQMVGDKLKGLTKEDKAGINAAIVEQLQWLESVTDDTTLDDIIERREAFEQFTQAIMNKLINPENGEQFGLYLDHNSSRKAGEKVDKTKVKKA